MKTTPILISLERDCWRLICSSADSERQTSSFQIAFDAAAGPLSLLQELAGKLNEIGYAGQEVCLGLHASFVYGVLLECDDLPRRQRQHMLLYRLEEQIPLAAEDLTAVFLPAIGGRCFALAVKSEFFMKILKGLSEAGIEVGPICPTALLALWACMQQYDSAANYVILCNRGETEMFRISEDVPQDWYSPSNNENLLNSLRISLLNYPAENAATSAMVVGQLDVETLAGIEREISVPQVDKDENSFERLAFDGASLLLAGKPAGWIDFRRDKLARKKVWNRSGGLMRAAAALSMIFIVALAATLIVRGMRYESVVAHYERQQYDAYKKLYPDRRVPMDVPSRLNSELRRMSGVLGHGQDIPEPPKALENLCTVIQKLPNKLKFRILKMQVEPSGITIEGQVKNHTDAEAIVRSLTSGGLEVLAPRTERLTSGDVSFVINAKPSAEKSSVVHRGARR